MRSANLSAPLQGLRLYQALLGLSQAAGLAGGFDTRKEVACDAFFWLREEISMPAENREDHRQSTTATSLTFVPVGPVMIRPPMAFSA